MAEKAPLRWEIVRPIPSDAKMILEWRNDPFTRQMSRNQKRREWEPFFSHFRGVYCAYPDLPSLFIVQRGERVGLLRFTPFTDPLIPSRRCCEVSTMVAPEARGQGIASQAFIESKEWVLQQGFSSIYAEVKPDNVASKKMLLRAGYEKIGTVERCPLGEEPYTLTQFLCVLEEEKKRSVFIVAEAGSNWRAGPSSGDLTRAKQMIECAKEAGADAVKFQVFRPETIYAPHAGAAGYLEEGGIEKEMDELFSDLAMPYEMIPLLAEHSKKVGIEWLASAFSVEDLEKIDPFVTRHKIASCELEHVRLLEWIAKTGKPTMLSTGAATEAEIAWAVEYFQNHGGGPLTLMQCTVCYPAPAPSLHLRAIPRLHQRFALPVGLSDHSEDSTNAPVVAVAYGAQVIEKHFTLDRSLPGPDHRFAVDPQGLKQMVDAIRLAEEQLGSEHKTVYEEERELRAFAKRGVQATAPIEKGECFSEGKNIAILRPGKQTLGVSPKYIEEIEGKPAARTLSPGEGITWEDWHDR